MLGMLSALMFVLMMATASASAQVNSVNKVKDAAKTAVQQQPQDDEDEKLDESFRKFGGAAGAVYQCAADSEKEKVVSDVRRAFNRIGQLFGTDRAFFFAASFGKATDAPFDKAKCAELTTKLRESVLVKRLAN